MQLDLVLLDLERGIGASVAAIPEQSEALVVLQSFGLLQNVGTIAALALDRRLPSIYPWRQGTERGGLLAYAANIDHLFRRAAEYVDKILKGARPAELPVEQPTTFDFVINLKTARALGLTIPPSVLAQATKVIE